jgi:hypothetical protein
MPFRRYKQNFNISYKRFSAQAYAVLYNALSSYAWSSLYKKIIVDAAVDRWNIAVAKAIHSTVPSG